MKSNIIDRLIEIKRRAYIIIIINLVCSIYSAKISIARGFKAAIKWTVIKKRGTSASKCLLRCTFAQKQLLRDIFIGGIEWSAPG